MDQFNWAVRSFYGKEDNALREAFAYLTYAATARGIGNEERERQVFEQSKDRSRLRLTV